MNQQLGATIASAVIAAALLCVGHRCKNWVLVMLGEAALLFAALGLFLLAAAVATHL